jgi:flagellar protein FliJ
MRSSRRVIEDKSRQVEELNRIIREFDRTAADLELQVKIEEDRTQVRDQSHSSYSTFAKAAAQRRDNLRQSSKRLRERLAAEVRERDGAMEQLSADISVGATNNKTDFGASRA